MIEKAQDNKSNAAEFFSLKLIKETKEMYVFSVIFPQASKNIYGGVQGGMICLLYTSPSPRDGLLSRMPSSA